MSQELSGSSSDHSLNGISTIYVYGWPGQVVKDSLHHDTPGYVVAKSDLAGQNLTFRPAGLGVLRLDATNLHVPGSGHVLTVLVPEDVDVQERSTPDASDW